MAANNPFPVSGNIYDTDGILLSGALVTFENITNHEDLDADATSNVAGEYLVDGGNTDSGVSAGDVIAVRIDFGTASAEIIAEVSSGDIARGYWETDIYLRRNRLGRAVGGVGSLRHITITNLTTTAAKIWLLDRSTTPAITFKIKGLYNVANAGTTSDDYSSRLPFNGGMRVIETLATTNLFTLAEGTINAVGANIAAKTHVIIE